jgi:hypothetical protein
MVNDYPLHPMSVLVRPVITRTRNERQIGYALLEQSERGRYLRGIELALTKYMILKTVYQLGRPDLFAHRLLVTRV